MYIFIYIYIYIYVYILRYTENEILYNIFATSRKECTWSMVSTETEIFYFSKRLSLADLF